MRELEKQVQLGDFSYTIKKMDPRTGSWLAVQLASFVMPPLVEAGLGNEGLNLPSNSKRKTQISEEEFYGIQEHCLKACAYLPPGEQVPRPLLHASGRFNFPEQMDVVTVLLLTVHALVFNVAPFFDPAAQELIRRSFANLSPRPAEASTLI